MDILVITVVAMSSIPMLPKYVFSLPSPLSPPVGVLMGFSTSVQQFGCFSTRFVFLLILLSAGTGWGRQC